MRCATLVDTNVTFEWYFRDWEPFGCIYVSACLTWRFGIEMRSWRKTKGSGCPFDFAWLFYFPELFSYLFIQFWVSIQKHVISELFICGIRKQFLKLNELINCKMFYIQYLVLLKYINARKILIKRKRKEKSNQNFLYTSPPKKINTWINKCICKKKKKKRICICGIQMLSRL